MGSELRRISNVQAYPALTVTCERCGKDFMLHYNGGELDQHYCCGLRYFLEDRVIDFVIEEAVSGD